MQSAAARTPGIHSGIRVLPARWYLRMGVLDRGAGLGLVPPCASGCCRPTLCGLLYAVPPLQALRCHAASLGKHAAAGTVCTCAALVQLACAIALRSSGPCMLAHRLRHQCVFMRALLHSAACVPVPLAAVHRRPRQHSKLPGLRCCVSRAELR